MDGQYWDVSWNPVKDKRGGYHCTKCSPGCANCWAEWININRLKGQPYDNAQTELILDEKVLRNSVICGHKKEDVFVCDLCDLFHPQITDAEVCVVLNTLQQANGNRYLILTKRPERMAFFAAHWAHIRPHMYFGVTVCTQQEADTKLPVLHSFDTKARPITRARRWVSVEPLLERISIRGHLDGINWVTVGAESLGGRAGRECPWLWVKDIVEQCREAGVKVWVKQIHYHGQLVRKWEDLPAEVRIRERPV